MAESTSQSARNILHDKAAKPVDLEEESIDEAA
jgi:hypothetical protein